MLLGSEISRIPSSDFLDGMRGKEQRAVKLEVEEEPREDPPVRKRLWAISFVCALIVLKVNYFYFFRRKGSNGIILYR